MWQIQTPEPGLQSPFSGAFHRYNPGRQALLTMHFLCRRASGTNKVPQVTDLLRGACPWDLNPVLSGSKELTEPFAIPPPPGTDPSQFHKFPVHFSDTLSLCRLLCPECPFSPCLLVTFLQSHPMRASSGVTSSEKSFLTPQADVTSLHLHPPSSVMEVCQMTTMVITRSIALMKTAAFLGASVCQAPCSAFAHTSSDTFPSPRLFAEEASSEELRTFPAAPQLARAFAWAVVSSRRCDDRNKRSKWFWEGATGQGMRVASRSGKSQRNRYLPPLEVSRWDQPC